MRTLLDCKGVQIDHLSEKQKERIEKTLDSLNVPKDGTVQLNVGTQTTERINRHAIRSI